MFHQTFQNHLNKFEFEGKIALPAFRNNKKKIKCTLRVALFCLHFMVEIIRVSHIKKYLYIHTLWLCGKTFSLFSFSFSIIILFWTAAATTRNWHKFMILFLSMWSYFMFFMQIFQKEFLPSHFWKKKNKRWENRKKTR